MKNNLARLSQPAQLSSHTTVEMVVAACMDAKGKDVVSLNVAKDFGLADYFVIASGRSDRQVQGIANKIIDELSSRGIDPLHVEGFDAGHWIILDYGDVVAHIFYEAAREQFDLEGLWFKSPREDFKEPPRAVK